MKPLLTICVPTYNSEKTIKRTLESILAQNYPNFEILVSDNESTDRTEEVIKSLKRPEILFRKNIQSKTLTKEHFGCYDNCNGCIKSGLIRGKFVAFYHSDDIYYKDIAKKEVEFLINNPEVGAVFTLGNLVNKKGKVIRKFKLPKELRKKNIYDFMDIFKALLKNGNTFLQTPTFMTRKSVFARVGLFNEEEFRASGDLEMWLRIAKKYRIGIIPEKLIYHREGGIGKKYRHLSTKRAYFFAVMDHYLNQYTQPVEKKLLRQYEYQKRFNDTFMAMNFLIKNEEEKAKTLISQKFSLDNFLAVLENPTILKIKEIILRSILVIGIKLKLGRYLGKILHKLRFS